MSTSTPLPPAHDPNINWHQPDHLSSTADLPPDPLLDAGSFIDANSTTAYEETLNKKEPIRDNQSAKPTTENGAKSVGNSPLRPATTVSAAGEKPDWSWLPANWKVEERLRTSGQTAGLVDKYYFDPVSNRRFRSKKEVLYFLETGTTRNKRKADTDPPGSSETPNKQKKSGGTPNKQKKSGKGKTTALNFDYVNVPEKVEWVLTATSEDSWTAFIGKDEVPESTRKEWAAVFKTLTTSHGGHTLF